MLHKSLSAFCLIAVGVGSALRSEHEHQQSDVVAVAVPENVIRGWQNSAPEALDITVLSIDETSTTRPYGNSPGNTPSTAAQGGQRIPHPA